MQINKYIYTFAYDHHESELCKLESRYILHSEDENKQLLCDVKVDPSHSAFIKRRLDVLWESQDYLTFINAIKNAKISKEGFKVEYLVLEGDATLYEQRLEKLKDIGYLIEGIPDYYNPTVTYALCNFNSVWYFGVLVKNNFDWNKHKQKPFSYSNSINIKIAKALVNIASQSNMDKKMLDACCGVGTIMLEACFAGYYIDGCDINWKVCRQARANLAHFDYKANVYRSDIKDIESQYDSAIIDLPYNLFSSSDESIMKHIIQWTGELAALIVIVSITDIKDMIDDAGLRIINNCSVGKSGKKSFARRVWVCEKK